MRLSQLAVVAALCPLAIACAVQPSEGERGTTDQSISMPVGPCGIFPVSTPMATYWDGYSSLEPAGRRIGVVLADDTVFDSSGNVVYDYVFVDVDSRTVVARSLVEPDLNDAFTAANPLNESSPSIQPANTPPPPPPPSYKDQPPACVPDWVVDQAVAYYFAPSQPTRRPPPPINHVPGATLE